ncbi:MAG: hypothetical protein ACON5H_05730 [Akkermansiaceae bacterium]
MKTLLTILLVLTCLLSARTVEELNVSYQGKVDALVLERSGSLKKLNQGYLKRLSTIKVALQKEGELELVEKVQNEISNIEGNIWPLKPLEAEASSSLKKARKLYTDARLKIERKHAGARVTLADTMLALLEKRKVTSTQQGELQEARAARSLIKKLTEDQELKTARVLSRVSKSGSDFVPAVRLRRFGDQLEVLVGYDQSGKISLKSPVQDVQEITGAKKEKGNSAAQSLGQFVGARGFKSTPLVIFQKIFTKQEDASAFSVAGFRADGIKTYEDEKGFTVSLTTASKNSNIAIANILPPKTAPGRYRITCRYFIPSSNSSLIGFSAYQGFGQAIEGHVFKTKGKWSTKTLESDSLNNLHHFRIYPTLKSGKTLVDAANESISIGHLTIEQLRFSAFLCEKFDEDGELLSTWPNEADQKLFISDGKLLPN